MPDSIYHDMLSGEARSGWIRLRTIVLLRWLAVAGQTAAVVLAASVLDIVLPTIFCGIAILASVLFNLASIQIFRPNARLTERAAMISMLFDLCQVSLLLFLTGGLTNPFSVLLLAPVIVSASVLRLRAASVVALAAFAAISLMAFWHMPLVFASGAKLTHPPIYDFGIWSALTIGILFIAIYARRVAVENYRMTLALNAAQRALASEQRLTAIGGLAAAAAHELGTPLATIKLVSSELADELSDQPELLEDAQLIRRQADRCRDILADLSEGGRSDEHVKRAPITAIIEEAAEPHQDRGRQIIIRVDGAPLGAGNVEPIEIRREPEIVHGLRNLIQNAVDFAESTIWVDVKQGASTLRILVGDDGPGYPDDLIDHLGDPYIRSRSRAPSERAGGEAAEGMGLGLFIAKTLLERSGARVSFANTDRGVRRANRGLALELRRPTGAVVAVSWAWEAIGESTGDLREALRGNQKFTVENI